MSLYRWAMRVGSQILFWLSLLIVVMSIVSVVETMQELNSQGLDIEGLKSFTRFKLILTSVGQSLLLGAVPFSLAVIINRMDRFLALKGTAE